MYDLVINKSEDIEKSIKDTLKKNLRVFELIQVKQTLKLLKQADNDL